MGYFEEDMLLPIFTVKCITHRKDPIFLMTIEGPKMGDAEILRMISLEDDHIHRTGDVTNNRLQGRLAPSGWKKLYRDNFD